jgi:hypothetical protein
MSTVPAPPHHPVPGEALTGQNEIRIVSHSTLFYWWPVWAVGFIMALITLIDGHVLAVVPPETEVAHITEKWTAPIKGSENKSVDLQGRDVLVPKHKATKEHPNAKLEKPYLKMARNKNLGVIFCTILLLVIAITNIPLRGLWSVIVIVVIVFTTIIFGLVGWWQHIVDAIELLDIRINLAGYLVISTVLLIIWLITLFLFDQQIYMVFTPGQLRVRLEIGEGETAYDTRGMTIQKQRSDLFRHWILGLGSGDLIVNTSGAQVHHFDLPNVLFVGRKVKEIEEMLRAMPVVRGSA